MRLNVAEVMSTRSGMHCLHHCQEMLESTAVWIIILTVSVFNTANLKKPSSALKFEQQVVYEKNILTWDLA